MTLDQFAIEANSDDARPDPKRSVGELFSSSAYYELHQAAYGLAQTVDLQQHLDRISEPEAADTFIGRQAQLVGRGIGSFLPVIAIAAGAKFALGRALSHTEVAAENLLLKKSAIGLSIGESALTGAVSGSLLKPTDDATAKNGLSFLADRVQGGVSNALAFSAMSLSTHGLDMMANSHFAASLRVDGLLKNSLISGVVSGALGGVANVEADSLVSTGRFSADGDKLLQSASDMAVMGGLFGATSSILARVGRSDTGPLNSSSDKVDTSNTLAPAATAAGAETGLPLKVATVSGADAVYTPDAIEPINTVDSSHKLSTIAEMSPTETAATRPEKSNVEIKRELRGHFRSEPEAFAKLLNLVHKEGSNSLLSEINEYITDSPATRVPSLATLMRESPDINLIQPTRMVALESLNRQFGAESNEMQRILKTERTADRFGIELADLAKFVDAAPASRIPLVKEALGQSTDPSYLTSERLDGVERLRAIYHDGDPFMTGLLEAESKERSIKLGSLAKFIQENPSENSRLVQEFLNAEDFNLSGERLKTLNKVASIFGKDSQVYDTLLQASKGPRSVDISELNTSLESMSELRKGMIEDIVASGSELASIAPSHLDGLEKLQRIYPNDFQDLSKLYDLENFDGGEETSLSVIADWVLESPQKRGPLFDKLLSSAELRPISFENLVSLEKISDTVGAESPAMQFVFDSLRHDSYEISLPSIANAFVFDDTKSLLEKLAKVDDKPNSKRLANQYFTNAVELSRIIGLNSPSMDLALKSNSGSEIGSLVSRLRSDPEAHQYMLNLHVDAQTPDFSLGRFLREDHSRLFSILNDGDTGASLRTKILSAKPESSDISDITTYIRYNKHADFLEAMLDLGITGSQFKRLSALEFFDQSFSSNTEYLRKTIELDKHGLSLDVLENVFRGSTIGDLFAAKNLFKGDVPRELDEKSLRSHMSETSLPALVDGNLLNLLQDAPECWRRAGAIFALSDFVEADPVNRADMVKRLFSVAIPDSSVHWFESAEDLYKLIGKDGALFEKVMTHASFDLDKITQFIAEDPKRNKEFLERQIDESDHWFDVARVKDLSDISRLLQDDPHLQSRLNKIIDVSALAEFTRLHPGESDFVRNFVRNESSAAPVTLPELESLSKLAPILGQGSELFKKVMAVIEQDKSSFLSNLVMFLQGDARSGSNSPESVEGRKNLLESISRDRASWRHFDPLIAKALDDMDRQFGADSDVMKTVRESDGHGRFDTLHGVSLLPDLRDFAATNLGKAIMAEIPTETRVRRSLFDLPRVVEFEQKVQPDAAMSLALVQLLKQDMHASELLSFTHLLSSPDKITRVSQILQDGGGLNIRTSNILEAMEWLDANLEDKSVVEKLFALESSGLDLWKLRSNIYALDAKEGLKLLSDLAHSDAPASEFSPEKVSSRIWVISTFGTNTPVAEQIFAREKAGLSLEALRYVATQMPHGNDEVAKLIREGRPVEGMSGPELLQRTLLGNQFGYDTPVFDKLSKLAGEGFELHLLRESVQRNNLPVHDLIRLLDDGVTRDDLKIGRIDQLMNLYRHYPDSKTPRELRDLEAKGLSLAQLWRIFESNPLRATSILTYLRDGLPPGRLTVDYVRDMERMTQVAQSLDPSLNAADYLSKLQRNGLSGAQVSQYLAERPTGRKGIIEQLIGENADTERFKDQMKLIAFPDDIATVLADKARSGGMGVSEIVRNLRDWKYGKSFCFQVTQQIRTGKPIELADMQNLVISAREHADMPKDALQTWESGFRKPSEATQELAYTLESAADSMETAIPRDKPVVLLGRDAWPLLPVIRAKGFDAQYFLWSRANDRDPNTYAQWLKETKPHSVVIDTGYRGSILDMIREKDKSAAGYLLSTRLSGYQRILQDPDHHSRIAELENLVKYIRRSQTYTPKGGAKTLKGYDGDNGQVAGKFNDFERKNRWDAQAEIRDVLRASGLSRWDTWRYSSFVGLTPEERLGLGSRKEVLEHYRVVDEQRRSEASTLPAEHSDDAERSAFDRLPEIRRSDSLKFKAALMEQFNDPIANP